MITYCTNIHPGESWADVFSNLKKYVTAVKQAVSPHKPFPIGLRLSDRAASELASLGVEQFSDWLDRNGCFVPTVNGFPFGTFHGAGLKEGVYLPDWRSPDRVRYSKNLLFLLSLLLPDGMAGSVSTVPVGFKGHLAKGDMGVVRGHLAEVAEYIDLIRQETGKDMVLALEPEPGCWIETAEEAVRFFERMSFPESLKSALGICLDCCHQAVEFEKPRAFLDALSRADIRLGKVQVSSGMSLMGREIEGLSHFVEPCYLHQIVVRRDDGRLDRYRDIPEALASHKSRAGEEWRVHFHLPVYLERYGPCGTTRAFVQEALDMLPHDLLLEVETYTWEVRPFHEEPLSVIDSLAREIGWVGNHLSNRGEAS